MPALEVIARRRRVRAYLLGFPGCTFSRAIRAYDEALKARCERWKVQVGTWLERHPEVGMVLTSNFFTDQPPFINRCVIVATTLLPQALLDRAQEVEHALGRDRSREQHWGPRTADIDILAYDDVVLATPALTLPHPRLFERAFVLVPLAEIAGDRIIAGTRVRDALAGLDTAGIERLVAR